MLNCFWGFNRNKQAEQRKYPLPKVAQRPEQDTAKGGDSRRTGGPRVAYHWLQVNTWGDLSLQQANTSAAADQYGVSARDVGLVDPQEGFKFCPTKLAARGQTLLVCLEGLRLLISKHSALIFSLPLGEALQEPTAPFSDSPYVRDLVSRLRISSYPDRTGEYVDKSLPFELVVLEWALSTSTKLLTDEVLAFERNALPVVEALAAKVSSKSISNMRKVKFGLGDLTSRVERYRQELQAALGEEASPLSLSRKSSYEDHSTGGGARRDRRKSRLKPLLLEGASAAEIASLVECYLIQIDAGLNSVRHVAHSSSSTEAMVRLNMKQQRLRLGHAYC